jgi:hypothetical protein
VDGARVIDLEALDERRDHRSPCWPSIASR